MVIVKKSFFTTNFLFWKLLVTCQLAVGCVLVTCRPTVGRQVFWGALLHNYQLNSTINRQAVAQKLRGKNIANYFI